MTNSTLVSGIGPLFYHVSFVILIYADPGLGFVVAAVFEVGGDAVICFRLKGNSPVLFLFGVATIGSYGLIVNSMDWDFSTIFGVYVALFAAIAILFGKFIFRENIPATTWIGLGFILVGGLIIQLGSGH